MSDLLSVRVSSDPTLGCGIGGPFCFDLTRRFLASLQPPQAPLVVGDDWALRVWVGSSLAASVDLTGVLVEMTVKKAPFDPVGLTRRSDAPPEVVLDSQLIDNGAGGLVGRGWFTVNFASTALDTQKLRGLVGLAFYDVRLFFAGPGPSRSFLQGRIEILSAISVPFP